MTALFRKAEASSAFLKAGLLGFAGSGKTFTATLTAIGLVEHLRKLGVDYAAKPAFMIDTEVGSDWILPRFNEAGIDLHTAKTRAFIDLVPAVKEAETNASVLVIDSITAFWREFCDTYARRKREQLRASTYRLQFQDWAFLKAEWQKFTDAFLNSRLHIVLCGRAGFEYDFFEDEDGKKQLEKTGVKMKAEGEMGYEPSLLVLMEREMNMETKQVHHIARVLKDRSTLLDGKDFADPNFASFLPHIACLNLGGQQFGVDTTRTSDSVIPADPRDNRRVQRKIVLDEIESLLVEFYPGQSAAEKKAKQVSLRDHWHASWTEMSEVMSLEQLRAGFDGLHRELRGEASRYAAKGGTAKVEINDELPGDLGQPKAPVNGLDPSAEAYVAMASG